MRIISTKPGVVRRNSSSSSPQKRNSFRGNQDPLGHALNVASPPSSTSSRKIVKKKKLQSIPTVPSLTSSKQQAPPSASGAMAVARIPRRRLGSKDGQSVYQKQQQGKKDHKIVTNMINELRDSYKANDRIRMRQVKTHLKHQVYGDLGSKAFKEYWSEASEALKKEALEDEEQKKEGNKRKRTSEYDMPIPKKRSSIGSETDTRTIPRKRSSIRSSISSEGDTTIPKKSKKRPSQPEEVVCLVDTDDDEQEWGDEDNPENEKVAKLQKNKNRKNKKKRTIEVPTPVVQVDPFEGAGPNRWANLIVGSSNYQGERFALGQWGSIQPVVK